MRSTTAKKICYKLLRYSLIATKRQKNDLRINAGVLNALLNNINVRLLPICTHFHSKLHTRKLNTHY